VASLRKELSALPVEGRLPGFDGATGWLNSSPLTPAELRGRVVLADFWTYTCINWLRTLGYLRAWTAKYEDRGLVLVGVHTPEFPFEGNADNVRWAVNEMRLEFPVALDPDYAVWNAFGNRYWPALYIADAEGQIRHHQFGEGDYEECERIIQRLLHETGADGVPNGVVSVADEGFEAQADWANLQSPETYLGYERGGNPASSRDSLRLNEWALSGDWKIESRACVLNGEGGVLSFRFHARDVHLILGPRERGTPVPFRVLIDGEPPDDARGLDVDSQGDGTVSQQRLYQLVRQPGAIADRTLEISFPAGGVEAFCFTFG
jgi:Thioredoxin like C-terminal domain/AhpC/TSA family